MDKKKPVLTQQTPIVRHKKVGPLSMVYVARKHIGTIINPIVGGAKKNLNKFVAMHKELKTRKSHKSRKDAIDWLSKSGGYSTKINEQEINPSDKLYGQTNNMNNKIATRKSMNMQIVKKNPNVQYQQIVYDNNKEAFLDVYKKALLRNEELFDKDKNKKDPNAGPNTSPKENPETGNIEVEIKKTKTGEIGDIISINPKLKPKPKEKSVDIKPAHKKAPGS